MEWFNKYIREISIVISLFLLTVFVIKKDVLHQDVTGYLINLIFLALCLLIGILFNKLFKK